MMPMPSYGAQPLDLQGLDSLLQRTQGELEDLLARTNSLPAVAPDGSSDCPFAERLYFQKQELERRVVASVATLQVYLREVEKELNRCSDNLEVISSRKTLLNHPDPKRQFSEAEVAQSREYNMYVEKRNRILHMLNAAQAVLAESYRKQYPGGAKDRWSPPATGPDAGSGMLPVTPGTTPGLPQATPLPTSGLLPPTPHPIPGPLPLTPGPILSPPLLSPGPQLSPRPATPLPAAPGIAVGPGRMAQCSLGDEMDHLLALGPLSRTQPKAASEEAGCG